ncbi:MAG: hypothetical protein HXS54_01280 [Theionarchaea archaeon]|nr:hypothetical protein [Theionarchaea archaeon]
MKQQINKAGEQSTGMAEIVKDTIIIMLKREDIENLVKKKSIDVTGVIKGADITDSTKIIIHLEYAVHEEIATRYGKDRQGAYVKIPSAWADEYNQFAVIPLKIEAPASENEKEAIG